MKNFKLNLLMNLIVLLTICATAEALTSKRIIASTLHHHEVKYISVDELKALLAKQQAVFIIDARGSDFDASRTKITGAIHITPAEIEKRLKEIPRGKTIITYCACSDDGGAVKAAETLMHKGYTKVKVLKGGWDAWNKANGTVEEK